MPNHPFLRTSSGVRSAHRFGPLTLVLGLAVVFMGIALAPRAEPECSTSSCRERNLESPNACAKKRIKTTRAYLKRRLSAAARAQRHGETDASESVLDRHRDRFESKWGRMAKHCPSSDSEEEMPDRISALIDTVTETLAAATDPSRPRDLETTALCEGADVGVRDGQCQPLGERVSPAISKIKTSVEASRSSLSRPDEWGSLSSGFSHKTKPRRCAAYQMYTAKHFSSCQLKAVSRLPRASAELTAALGRCSRSFERRWNTGRAKVCGQPGSRPGPLSEDVEALLAAMTDQLGASLQVDPPHTLAATTVCTGRDVVVGRSGSCQSSPMFQSERTLAGLTGVGSRFDYVDNGRYRLTLDSVEPRVALYHGRPLVDGAHQDLRGWLETWPLRGTDSEDATVVLSGTETGGSTRIVIVEVFEVSESENGSLEFEVSIKKNDGTSFFPEAEFGVTQMIVDDDMELLEEGETGLLFVGAAQGTLRRSEREDALILSLRGMADSAMALRRHPDKTVRSHSFVDLIALWNHFGLEGSSGPERGGRRLKDRAALTFRVNGRQARPTVVTIDPASLQEVATNASSAKAAFPDEISLAISLTETNRPLESLVGVPLDDLVLTAGDAVIQETGNCVDDSQCLAGSQRCDPEFGVCLYKACSADILCNSDEYCWESVTELLGPSCTNDLECSSPSYTGCDLSTGRCQAAELGLCIDQCTGALDCEGPFLACDVPSGRCQPKTCSASVDCGTTAALCLGGVCQEMTAKAVASSDENIISIGCNTTDKTLEAIAEDARGFCKDLKATSGAASDARALCEAGTQAMIARTINLTQFLRDLSPDRSQYCYTIESGQGHGLRHSYIQDCEENRACGVVCPSPEVRGALVGTASIFNTTVPNYINRFTSLATGSGNYFPFSDGAGYQGQADLLNEATIRIKHLGPYWENWWQVAAQDYALSQETGWTHSYNAGEPGGGCTVQVLGGMSAVNPPEIVSGGGFEFSVDTKGMVIAKDAHGIHGCSDTPTTRASFFNACTSPLNQTTPFGHEAEFCRMLEPQGSPIATAYKGNTDDRRAFQNAFRSISNDLLLANSVHLTCGLGGNPSFSAGLKGQPWGAKTTYSYGIGGALLARITKVSPTDAYANTVLYSPIVDPSAKPTDSTKITDKCPCESDTDHPCGTDCHRAPIPHPEALTPEPSSVLGWRGLYDREGNLKAASLASPDWLDGLTSVYQPYHFSLSSEVTPFDSSIAAIGYDTLENVYIPGSNSPAEAFVERWKLDENGYKASEVPRIQGLQSAVFTLNLNPLYFDYSEGASAANNQPNYPRNWGPVARQAPPEADQNDADYGLGEDARYYDINAMTVEMLIEAGVEDLSLVVPISPAVPNGSLVCEPDQDSTPAVVVMNAFWIDRALQLAETYNRVHPSGPIKKIVLGDGAYPVKMGFDAVKCTQADWVNYRDICQGIQEYFRFEDYYDLLEYTIRQIEDSSSYPELAAVGITLAIGQRLNLGPGPTGLAPADSCQNDTECQSDEWCYRSYASANKTTTAGYATSDYGYFAGSCTPRTGWTDCTDTQSLSSQTHACSGSDEMSLLQYLSLGPDDPGPAGVGGDRIQSLVTESSPVQIGEHIFMADPVSWSLLPVAPGAAPLDFATAELALEAAMEVAISQMGSASSGSFPGSGATRRPVLQAGWYSNPLSSDPAFSRNLQALRTGVESRDFVFALDQLFDQPWKSLPADLPGMPASECGRVFASPAAKKGSEDAPPGGSFFPAVCAGTQMPWGPNLSKCLCLNNITQYPTQAHPFVSDLNDAGDSGIAVLVSPNITTTFARHQYREVKTDPDSAKNKNATFSEFAVFGDGIRASSYLAGTWNQWPEPQLPHCCTVDGSSSGPSLNCESENHAGKVLCPHCQGCKTWNNLPCSPCGTTRGQWVKQPDKDSRHAIPGMRCAMTSDAQTKYATFNNALECPRLWYQFYCDGANAPWTADNLFCERPKLTSWNAPPDFNQAEMTPYDPWDLQCLPGDPANTVVPAYGSVTRIERTRDQSCVKLQWTAKGSAYDWVSGWEIKTLAPPCAQREPQRAETEYEAQDISRCKNNLAFEQAPLNVLPKQDLMIDHVRREVSGVFNTCDNIPLFPYGFKRGQYWWRIQPFAGEQLVPADSTPGFQGTPLGSVLASVDAIDIEYDPICHLAGDITTGYEGPTFDRVGKFTIGIWESDHPEITDPPTRFSKISRAEFVLPELYQCNPDMPCASPHTSGESRSFFMTPGRDNITSDFSLPGCPGKPCKATDSEKAQRYTTTMNLHFWDDIEQDGFSVFDRETHCRVDLMISAGKDFGNQGGQAVITHIYPGGCQDGADCSANREPIETTGIPLDHPEQACYLELQGDRKTVNGANFEFCGDQAKKSNLCKAPCENSCCLP